MDSTHLSPVAPDAARERVLVIDDDEAVRSVAVGMLDALGFEALSAPDGATGLALFRIAPEAYSFVLLDVTMPRMPGGEVFLGLRASRPDVRVILMSGFDYAETAQQLSNHGGVTYIQKPFGLETLGEAVRESRRLAR